MSPSRTQNKVNRSYHEWLVSLVDGYDIDISRDYSDLMACMDEFPFYSDHPWDENRVNAVYAQREFFIRDVYKGPPGVVISRDFVSLLEVLVNVLTGLNDSVFTEPGDKSIVPEFFSDFLAELDLLWCDNRHFDVKFSCKKCEMLVKKDPKLQFYGVNMDPKLDFWAQFSTILCKKF